MTHISNSNITKSNISGATVIITPGDIMSNPSWAWSKAKKSLLEINTATSTLFKLGSENDYWQLCGRTDIAFRTEFRVPFKLMRRLSLIKVGRKSADQEAALLAERSDKSAQWGRH